IDNLCAACRASVPDHPEDAAALAIAAHQVFQRRGPLHLGIDLFDACLEHPLPDALRGHLLRFRGTAALALGRTDEALANALAAGNLQGARDNAEQAVSLFDSIGAREHVGHHRLLLATIAWAQGDRRGARAALEQACATLTLQHSSQDIVLLLDLILRIDEGE